MACPEHIAWDHLGKYSETPSDHVILATPAVRFYVE